MKNFNTNLKVGFPPLWVTTDQKALLWIGAKLWKIGAIQNRYPIVMYGVMSDSESKNPRPFVDTYYTSLV